MDEIICCLGCPSRLHDSPEFPFLSKAWIHGHLQRPPRPKNPGPALDDVSSDSSWPRRPKSQVFGRGPLATDVDDNLHTLVSDMENVSVESDQRGSGLSAPSVSSMALSSTNLSAFEASRRQAIESHPLARGSPSIDEGFDSGVSSADCESVASPMPSPPMSPLSFSGDFILDDTGRALSPAPFSVNPDLSRTFTPTPSELGFCGPTSPPQSPVPNVSGPLERLVDPTSSYAPWSPGPPMTLLASPASSLMALASPRPSSPFPSMPSTPYSFNAASALFPTTPTGFANALASPASFTASPATTTSFGGLKKPPEDIFEVSQWSEGVGRRQFSAQRAISFGSGSEGSSAGMTLLSEVVTRNDVPRPVRAHSTSSFFYSPPSQGGINQRPLVENNPSRTSDRQFEASDAILPPLASPSAPELHLSQPLALFLDQSLRPARPLSPAQPPRCSSAMPAFNRPAGIPPPVRGGNSFDNMPARRRCCQFCKNNGERETVYRSHPLKDDITGHVTCPVLRKHVCDICFKTGNEAHTRKYCPSNPDPTGPTVKILQTSTRNSAGKRRAKKTK